MILVSCRGLDYGIRTVDIEFGQFPRVVYIAGVDIELDFSDATLVTIHADGHRNEFPFPELPTRWDRVEHSIDFNTPGIYNVKIFMHPDWFITFFVQVIDEEIFNELSGICTENYDYAIDEEE